MRLVPPPGPRRDTPGHRGDPIEAALHGGEIGPEAGAWRELRADVRTLAPPLDPQLARRLRERITLSTGVALAEPTAADPALDREAPATPPRPPAPGRRGWRAAIMRTRDRRRGLLSGAQPMRAGTLAAGIAVLIAAVFIAAPWHGASAPTARSSAGSARSSAGSAVARAPSLEAGTRADRLGPSTPQTAEVEGTLETPGKGAVASAGVSVAPEGPGAPGAGNSAGRVQQLSASLTLAPLSSQVQSVADRVARVAEDAGGYVRSSQVQQQQQAGSEANIELDVPSAHLGQTLAALGRIAPVHSESQGLQDITDAYDAAQRRLQDAAAARSALLRALAGASTAAEISSLRQQLALAGSAVSAAREALDALRRQASSSAVEVTVIGTAAAREGLTVHRGLHDAGRVLRGTLAVVLIALALLVPLALAGGALALAAQWWRRRRRERVLAGPERAPLGGRVTHRALRGPYA